MKATTCSWLGLLVWTAVLPAQQFRPDATLPLPAGSRIVLAEDLDVDGDTDFVLSLPGQVWTQILENLGDARFALQPNPCATPWSYDSRGDVDGDGDVDFVGTSTSVMLLRNDRTTLVDVTATNLVANTPPPSGTPILIDFDMDGDLDLITQTPGAVVFRLFLNSGSGVFTEAASIPMPPNPADSQWRVTDVDGDGHSDLVGRGFPATGLLTWIWRQGVYVDETAVRLPVLSDTVSMWTDLDFDGDGDMDLVLATRTPGRGPVLLANDGSGRFTDVTARRVPAVVDLFETVLPFDAEGDGDADLLLSGGSAPAVLLRNDGAGNYSLDTGNWRGDFSALPSPIRPLSQPRAIQAIDLDGDRFTDILGSDGMYRSVPGSGFRNLHRQQYARGLTADLDGDGDVDVLSRYLQRNDAGRLVFESTIYPSEALAIGDVDGDGDVDAIFGYRTDSLQVWLNGGAGTFAHSLSLPALMLFGAALGDVDGDGDLDLATADLDVPGVSQSRLLLNDGNGRFTDATATHLPTGLGHQVVVLLADVDADGDLDLLCLPYLGTQLRYLENLGSGVFVLSPTQPAMASGAWSTAAAFAQLDGDPALELVVQVANDFRMFDLVGGSWSNVTSTRIPGLAAGSHEFSLIDYDGDGDVDLLLRRQSAIRMFANDGTGTFTEVTARMGDGLSSIGTAADIDGDGGSGPDRRRRSDQPAAAAARTAAAGDGPAVAARVHRRTGLRRRCACSPHQPGSHQTAASPGDAVRQLCTRSAERAGRCDRVERRHRGNGDTLRAG